MNTIPTKSVYFSTKASTLVTSYKMVLATIRMIRYSSPGKSKTSMVNSPRERTTLDRRQQHVQEYTYTATRADEQELCSTLLHNNTVSQKETDNVHTVSSLLSMYYILLFMEYFVLSAHHFHFSLGPSSLSE